MRTGKRHKLGKPFDFSVRPLAREILRPSAYRLGWIGIRASRVGKAARLLKADHWIEIDAAGINNRNGFNWVHGNRTKEQFKSVDWQKLAEAGLVGVAAWVCDAQWGLDAGLTDAQWRDRVILRRG